MASKDAMIKRQRVLADFGDFALRSDDLYEVLAEACRLISETLDTPLAKVVEIENGDGTARVVAGIGWQDDIVGKTRLKLSERSSETYAIEQGEPLITRDINSEERFEFPDFMREAGVVALVNVPIFLPGGEAFGLLQVDDTRAREFDEIDIEFLRTYGAILGPVIDRLHKTHSLKDALERNQKLMSELQHRIKNNLATLAAVVRMRQRRTDDKAARFELNFVADRIDTLRLVHERLYAGRNIDILDLGAYLEQLLENILQMQEEESEGHEVSADIQVEEVEMSVDTVTPLGLIVNEFVTNSFKYAFAERGGTIFLRVECPDGDHVAVTLADDGPGLSGEAQPGEAGSGTGIHLIEALARQIDAETDWTCSAEGTCLRLKIPR